MTDAALNALRLPAVLRLVAEAAGVEAALKLSQARGGTRIYVPRKFQADHWLVALIGVAGANALRDYHAGETIDLPLGIGGSAQNARLTARLALDAGASVAQAARAAGLTERAVYALKSREARGPALLQLDLFGE